nr:phage tail protein [Microvirga roseola]
MRLFGVDAVASGGRIAWRGRGGRAVMALTKDDLVLDEREPSLKLSRAQETELPHQVEIGFTEGETDYRRAAVASRRLSGSSRREARADSAVVTRRAEAQRQADTRLQDLWAGRESAELELSPRRIEFEPGDVITLPTDAGSKLHRILRIADGPTRKVTARAVAPAVFERPGASMPKPVRRPCPASRWRSSSTCPPRRAIRRRCNTLPLRSIPGPAPSLSGARGVERASRRRASSTCRP